VVPRMIAFTSGISKHRTSSNASKGTKVRIVLRFILRYVTTSALPSELLYMFDALAFAQRPYWECPVTPLSGYSHQVRWSRILLYGCGRMPR